HLRDRRCAEDEANAVDLPYLLRFAYKRCAEDAGQGREEHSPTDHWLRPPPSRPSTRPRLYDPLTILNGSVNVNVDPTPTWLFTQIRPPCSSMNFRDSASPSPVPSTFLAAIPTCRNSSNTAS